MSCGCCHVQRTVCKYMYGLIWVYLDSDTECSSKEQWNECSLKVRECINLRNMPKIRFQRRQRVSQAKKRYKCYTEKNNFYASASYT